VPAVAALLDSRAAVAALRRALAGEPLRVVACRSPAGLLRAYADRMLDAVVLGLRALQGLDLDALRERYRGVPLILYGAVRPDTAGPIAALLEGPAAAAVVEGVDDPVVGDIVRRHGLGRAREQALTDAPRLLRLAEPVQLDAWRLVLREAGRPLRAGAVAARLGMSREHLSRQFGAGGAPNLKRVLDLMRVICAAQLLASPAYDARAAARILGFASASHLGTVARRVAGEGTARLAALGPRGVLAGFVRQGTRSRVR